MVAGYFNPKSIRVAKAEASWDGGALKVFVELRDVIYPGSTYMIRLVINSKGPSTKRSGSRVPP